MVVAGFEGNREWSCPESWTLHQRTGRDVSLTNLVCILPPEVRARAVEALIAEFGGIPLSKNVEKQWKLSVFLQLADDDFAVPR